MPREDQNHIKVVVAGRDLGTFEVRAGGAADSDETKYRLGGMGPTVSLGGPQTFENVTVRRLFRGDRDRPLLDFLYSQRGKGAMEVIDQGLDADGNTFGTPIVFKGTLKGVTVPDADSQSNDPALLELEQSVSSITAA